MRIHWQKRLKRSNCSKIPFANLCLVCYTICKLAIVLTYNYSVYIMQNKITNIIKNAAASHNLEVTLTYNWSNTGTMFITKANSMETVTKLDFWFYQNYVTFDARTRGETINPTAKALDYSETIDYVNHVEFENFMQRLVSSWGTVELQDLSDVIDSYAVA